MKSSWYKLYLVVAVSLSIARGKSIESSSDRYDEISDIQLRWLNDDTMQIRIPDIGTDQFAIPKTDLIFLSPSDTFHDEEDHCVFRGRLENNPAAIASIVGCIGEETLLNINLNGEVKELTLTQNGTTLIKVNAKRKSRRKRSETGGYLETTQPKPNVLASRRGSPPSAITMPFKLGYDFSLKRHFKTDSKAKQFVKQVFELSRPFLEDNSNLGTSVHLKINPTIEYTSRNFDADQMFQGTQGSANIQSLVASRKGILEPLVIFAEDKAPCDGTSATSGGAYRSSACGTTTGTNIAIIDLTFIGDRCSGNAKQDTAYTFVHEIGHMIGMKHDFKRDDGRDCDGEGHMSYGSTKRKRWSTCSIHDFDNWFNSIGFTCKNLESGTTSCGGHKAQTCKRCGTTPGYCNGDCTWDYDAKECSNKEILKPSFTIKKGSGWKNANGNIDTLKEVRGTKTSDCENACVKTPTCIGFTFVSSIDRCDLKKDEQAVSLDFSYDASIISGTLKLRHGAGWHNKGGSINSIKEVSSDNVEGCEKPCKSTSGCVGWTYVKNSKRCDLKSANDAISYSFQYADVVSGLI